MKSLTLLTLFVLLLTPLALADETKSTHENIKIFARIKSINNEVKLIRDEKVAPIVSTLKDKAIEKDIAALEAGDEALIEGHITYEPSVVEGKQAFKPIFVIESIRPISLKRLGKVEIKEHDQLIQLQPLPADFQRKGTIPVTAQVAGALTLTATLLMLQNQTATNEPGVKTDINSGLIFSAGALATGLFIYDQIIATKKNKGK